MPIAGLSYVTLTGTFLNLRTGLPSVGQLRFTMPFQIVNVATDNIVVPSDFAAVLDADGHFSISLPCTDDPDFLPLDRYWRVSEAVDGHQRDYAIQLPAAPSTQDLSAIAPIDPTDPAAVYTLAGAGSFLALVGDGITDDRAVLATADGTPGVALNVRPGATVRIGSNLTLTKPINLPPGATLLPDSGVVVTLNGLNAGLYKVFDYSHGGFVNPAGRLETAWWGDVAGGTVGNNRAAIQAAFDAAGRAGSVRFSGAGTHLVDGVTFGGRRTPLTATWTAGPTIQINSAALVPPGQTLLTGDTVVVEVDDFTVSEAHTVQSVTSTSVTFTTNLSASHSSGVVCSGPGQLLDIDLPKGTTLSPASGTWMFRCYQPTGTASDGLTWTGGGSISSTFNHDYAVPLIYFKLCRNMQFDRTRFFMTGRGTMVKFDASYASTWTGLYARMGRYAVMFELDNSIVQEIDTWRFDNCVIFGSYGPIVRLGLGTDIHNLRFPGLKIVVPQGPDFQTKVDAAIASAVTAGDSTVTLQTGQGASFSAGFPVFFDVGDKIEVNQVASVAGDVVTLSTPVRYNHTGHASDASVATPFMRGGFCISTPTTFNVVLENMHFEGTGIGWINAGGRANRLVNSFVAVNEHVRAHGKVQELYVGEVVANGPSGLGSQIPINYHPFGADVNASRFATGMFTLPSGSAALYVDPTTGQNIKGLGTQRWAKSAPNVSGEPEEVTVVPFSSLGHFAERFMSGSVTYFKRTIQGAMTWAESTNTLSRPSANVMQFGGRLNLAGGHTELAVAHIPSDADFPSTPADFTVAWNSVTGRKWTRIGGVWTPDRLVLNKSADYAANLGETVLMDASGGNRAVTIPTAAAGGTLTVKKIDATANTVQLTGTTDGVVNRLVTVPMASISLISNGTVWYIV